MECVYRLELHNEEGQEGEEEGTEQTKKKVANRILLGLHFVFACRKKKEKREKEGKNATAVNQYLMGEST